VILSPGNDLVADLAGVDCGWMLPDESVSAAARAIEEFALSDSESLKCKGENARLWAERNLSVESFNSRIQSLRDELFDGM
jgi:hypothetical protein